MGEVGTKHGPYFGGCPSCHDGGEPINHPFNGDTFMVCRKHRRIWKIGVEVYKSRPDDAEMWESVREFQECEPWYDPRDIAQGMVNKKQAETAPLRPKPAPIRDLKHVRELAAGFEMPPVPSPQAHPAEFKTCVEEITARLGRPPLTEAEWEPLFDADARSE